jgi:hypothetical protein
VVQRALQPAQVTVVPAPSAEQLQADAARAKDYSRKKVRPEAAALCGTSYAARRN